MSMEYAELSLRLPKKLSSQGELLWRRFCESGGSGTEHFLTWLHQQGHLSSQEFQDLITSEEIEIIEFDQTETFLQTRGFHFPSTDDSSESATDEIKPTAPLRAHYEMLGELGKGAMGLVHLAKDRDLQRKVAYKQLLTQSNRGALARFLREAQITAQLDHPHIVPIYGMEVQADGSLAYSMKLVQGKTFKELINETREFYDKGQTPDVLHSQARLLEDFLKACDAVAYAHSKGVIHRDLKPANIMVGRYNEVYVMDWGIARVMQRRDDMPEGWVELGDPDGEDNTLEERTRAGQILGTPRYMSPQQAAGKNDELDGRSDLFAMGLILYELLTLKPAFTAPNPIELLKKVLKAEKEPWAAYHASRKIPIELQAIVDRATGQKAHNRYNSVAELAEEIRRYLRGEAVLVRPDNTWRRLARWVGRHREISLLVLLGVLFLSGGAVIWSLVQQQQAMVEARERETRLVQLYTHVSQHGQTLNGYFQDMESLVHGLAATATQALTEGIPSQDPLYINNPLAKAPQKLFNAPDLIPSPYYTGEISPTWPIYVIAQNVDQRAIETKLRRLSPLRHPLKQVLMDSYTGGKAPVPKAQWDKLLANQGVPVLWSYIGLKEGVLFFYPGHDEPTIDYDVRIRPYYLQSRDKYEKVWGLPYDDPVGGMLIACTQGIFDQQQQFLGMVGIDIRLNYLREHYLNQLPNEPAVGETFLLNAKGEILLRSHASKVNKRLDLHETAQTPPYPITGVVKAIQAKTPGGTIQLSDTDPGDNRLVVYTRLNTLGWYYVVETEQNQIFAKSSLPTQPKAQ